MFAAASMPPKAPVLRTLRALDTRCHSGCVMPPRRLLSHHLRVLRDGGIIEGKRDGKAVLYRLSPDVQARRAGRSLDLGCCRLSFKGERA